MARQAVRLPHIVLVIVLGFAIAFLSQFGAIPVFVAQIMLYGFSEGGINGPENVSARSPACGWPPN